MSLADCMKRKQDKAKESLAKKARMETIEDICSDPSTQPAVTQGRFSKKGVRFSEGPSNGTAGKENAFARKRSQAVTPGRRGVKKEVKKLKAQLGPAQPSRAEETSKMKKPLIKPRVPLATIQPAVGMKLDKLVNARSKDAAKAFDKRSGAVQKVGVAKDKLPDVITYASNEHDESLFVTSPERVFLSSEAGGLSPVQPRSADYSAEIIKYSLSAESRFAIPVDFLKASPQISHSSRLILVDWLIQIQVHLDLSDVTLQLCVALIDQYLARKTVNLDRLQLLGVTCLLIASKYEDRFPPTINRLTYLTDYSCVHGDLITMERQILKVLAYQIFVPTAFNFVPWLVKSRPAESTQAEQVEMMSYYLLDLAAGDSSFSSFRASTKASAAVSLAHCLFALDAPSDVYPPPSTTTRKPSNGNNSNSSDYVEPLRKEALSDFDIAPMLSKEFGVPEMVLVECMKKMVESLGTVGKSEYRGAHVKFAKDDYLKVSTHKAVTSRKAFDSINKSLIHYAFRI